ncbi:hypothetical protein L0663_05120 [Dyadobacter sp. CY107]|uniref:hypothetical protein n=1 Tax=Dyadobacter fanqingshengii TaxID=2906443 RepID=UPI001F3032DF|nr:hypothetical protein [Dyadobacter fanqingshengii]MCF2502748.1 hypothetical protein [Dyadobacter fanqingshengii]
MTQTTSEFLEKLSDREILDEVERRDIMPEPEYYCECDQDDYRVNFDTLRKEALNKAIDTLRGKGDLSSALVLEDLLEDLR